MGDNLRAELRDGGMEQYGKFYGSYKAVVRRNDDPEGLCRLQLTVPQIYEGDYDYWALSKGVYSGSGVGFYFLPAVGDTVWVSFENGDPRWPVWEYGWFVKGKNVSDASPDVKILQTNSGHRITVDDTKGAELIEVKHKSGDIVLLDGTGFSFVGKKVSLGAKNGSDEAAALGETLKSILNDILTAIEQLTVSTAFGPSGTPINVAAFSSAKSKLDNILSKTVTLNK